MAAIELGMTLPVLLMLTLGAYDVSRLISARTSYQQALTQAAGLVMARPPQGNDTQYIKNEVAAAAKINTSKVQVTERLECAGLPAAVGAESCPSSTDEQARYVTIGLEGSYMPVWTHFGLDSGVTMQFSRTVRVQ